MSNALLRGNGLKDNAVFELSDPGNRDNCFAPYALLKARCLANGIQLQTADMAVTETTFLELHQDVQEETTAANNYLLMFETPFIKPENADSQKWKRYRKIFTWNDGLVGDAQFVKLNFPNPISIYPADGFNKRPRFCCLISGNRALAFADPRDLYVERVRAIRWFEKNAPQDFDLYGIGWNIPAAKSGLRGKLERKLWTTIDRLLPLKSFPSYRGKVGHKREVLTCTRFAICYENVRDLPGYITEKIFDCFFSGCVPVYWGAGNIERHIPADCFIDRRKFNGMTDLYRFLKGVSETDFIGYQQRIAGFLQSDAAYPFGSDFFADTIVNTIVQDLGRQA